MIRKGFSRGEAEANVVLSSLQVSWSQKYLTHYYFLDMDTECSHPFLQMCTVVHHMKTPSSLYTSLWEFDNCHFTCELHLHVSTLEALQAEAETSWSKHGHKSIHTWMSFAHALIAHHDFIHNDSKMRKETHTQRTTRKYLYVTMGDRLPYNPTFFSQITFEEVGFRCQTPSFLSHRHNQDADVFLGCFIKKKSLWTKIDIKREQKLFFNIWNG